MNEETVNKFTVGATVTMVCMYGVPGEYASVHVILDNGAMLALHGEIHGVDVLGPSDGEVPKWDDEGEGV